MAQLSIHPIMSIVRNTVVLRNAALGALVVLALFECNGFIAVRFGINGVFCKENRSDTLRASRVTVYTAHTRPCTRAVYTTAYTARRVHGRVKRPCTRADTAHTRPCIRPDQGRVYGRVTGVPM